MSAGRSYLDHASTAPLRPEAREAMIGALQGLSGDPGRIHEEGMAARVALEKAREEVARFLGARSREIVFTSGATESISAAVWGATERGRMKVAGSPHHVLTAVEHSAVRSAAERSGPVTVLGVDRTGRVDPQEVLDAIGPDTVAVHVQWGNHEVGTIQPVAEIAAGCRERGVLVHVDAAQAVGRLPVDLAALGADLVSVSGHKFGGPAGTGVLFVRRGLRLPPLLVGGDQERARRAGLEPVAALVGLGAAARSLSEPGRLAAEIEAAERRSAVLRSASSAIADVEVFGDLGNALPHLVCMGVGGVEPQGVLLGLDRAGVAAHSGSACSSESLEPSPVLEAMGVDAHRSLRLSVGWSTTDEDVERAVAALPEVIDRLRGLAVGR